MKSNKIFLKMDTSNVEEIAMFNAWADLVPKIFILDNCVVSTINALGDDSDFPNPLKDSVLNFLKSNDKQHNRVSILFTIIEKLTNIDTLKTHDEIIDGIMNFDIPNIKKFMPNTKLVEDREIINRFITILPDFISTMNAPRELFIYANDELELYNSPPTSVTESKKRLVLVEKLIKKATELDYNVNSPLLLLCIARIYGSINSQEILKFRGNRNKVNSSNSLGDVLALTRFNLLSSFLNKSILSGIKINPIFLTVDEPFYHLDKQFKFIDCVDDDSDDVRHTFQVESSVLMPCLFDEKNICLNKNEVIKVYAMLGIDWNDN